MKNYLKWISIILLLALMFVCYRMPSVHRVLDGESNDSIERIDTVIVNDSLIIDSIYQNT